MKCGENICLREARMRKTCSKKILRNPFIIYFFNFFLSCNPYLYWVVRA